MPPSLTGTSVESYALLREEGVLRLLTSWRVSVLHRLSLFGLKAWDLHLAPDCEVLPHEHELPFFCILLEGSLRNSYLDRDIVFHPFLNVFHPAGTVHSGLAGPRGAHILTLETTPEWESHIAHLATLPRATTIVPFEDGFFIARRLLRELRAPEACSELVLEGLALELVAAVVRAPRHERAAPSWMGRTLARLHERFAEAVTMRTVADELDVPAARLSAEFRRYTGLSFGDYLRSVRVDFVKERLRGPELPLSDIALAAGFSDQAHCTRVFKAVTGATPGKYRSARRTHAF